MTLFHYFLLGLAALAAGFVNALAGGGTLISFPTLSATGMAAIAANATNTTALSPGSFSALMAQIRDLRGQEKRLMVFLPLGVLGGLTGSLALLWSGEALFKQLAPYLIIAASLLLAAQEPIRAWVTRRSGQSASHPHHELWRAALPVWLTAVYGGYFGAGVGVVALAALGATLEDSLTRLNALKHAVTFSANLTAGLFFLFSGQVVWQAGTVMALGALAGGALGGRLASRVNANTLRKIVVSLGILIGLIYLFKN